MKEQTLSQEDRFGKLSVEYLVDKNLKDKYAQYLQQHHNTIKSKNNYLNISFVLRIAAIFIGSISVFFVLNNMMKNTVDNLALNYINNTVVLGNQNIMRKDVSLENAIRLKANEAFVLKNFEESVLQYSTLFKTNNQRPIDHFYLGISLLRIGSPDPKKAIAELNIASSEVGLTEEIDWFLSLAYIMNKDYTNAKKHLGNLILRGNYKTKEATTMLTELNK